MLFLTMDYFFYITLSVVSSSTEKEKTPILAVVRPLQKLNLVSLWSLLFLPAQKLLSHVFQCLFLPPLYSLGTGHPLCLKSLEQCLMFLMESESGTFSLMYLDSTLLHCSYQQSIPCGKFPTALQFLKIIMLFLRNQIII